MARAYSQAQKFGVEMAIPEEVAGIEVPAASGSKHFVLKLSNNGRACARSIVIASGARYRRLAVENLEAFESSSVHYWASPLEAKLCEPLVAAWTDRRSMLATQFEWLEVCRMRTGTNISSATTQQDIARLRKWIAELDALIAEHSK
jgi:hypothetical protein